MTGSRGYFGYLGSVFDRSQSENVEPRVLRDELLMRAAIAQPGLHGPRTHYFFEVRTFSRLLGFLRPYRAGVWWSLFFGGAAMVFTVAIPWLTGRAIDEVRAATRTR